MPMLDSLDALNRLDMPVAPVASKESVVYLAQEAERRRIARELHDGVVQTLTALVADLEYFRTRALPADGATGSQVAQRVEVWQSLARDGLDSMRQALGGLRSASDESFSTLHLSPNLPREIEALLARMQGYRVEFECDDWSLVLPGEYVSQLVSIVREALTNISKHANASRITVALLCFEESLFVSIADDGVGMTAPLSRYGNGYHLGLVGMRERVALLGGRMTLESTPGSGTRIDIDIPWEAS